MKKSILILFILSFSLCAFSQTFKVYSYWDEAMKEPEKVQHLDLALKQLKELPADIEKFVNLEILELSFNHLTDLPAELAKLQKLRILDLSGCRRMKNIPAVVKEIPNLKELKILEIPEWSAAKKEAIIKEFPNLKVVTKEE
jgi:Leucine-rich repeat (LRR) protein